MKKLFPILFAAIAFTACEKEPDSDKLDNKYLVYTDYDTDFDFKQMQTYYVPDSILYINSGEKQEFWSSESASNVLGWFIENMNKNFVRVDNIEDADLGLQLSYVASTYTFRDYVNGPWWNGYPYYWNPGYWGGYWGGWYYPYIVSYSYTIGSIIGEMVYLNEPESKKLPVVWDTYISGIINSSGNIDPIRTEAAINQAFIQSPYLNK